MIQRAQRVVFRLRGFVEVLRGLPKEVQAAWVTYAGLLASFQALLLTRVGHAFEV